MYKIQTFNKIPAIGLDLFPRDQYEIASELLHPDAILVRSADLHTTELSASLKAIARAGAGVNNIPIDKCSQRGIVVFNTPGANANGVKEIVLAAMLMSSRKIVDGIAWAKTIADKGDDVPALVEKGKSKFEGPEIKGKKLGVIGLGAIGVMVANDAIALGMTVTGYDPYISVEAAWGLSPSVKRAIGLESLIADSDYITIHVPLSDKTKGIINKDKFAIMKKGVRIINFARGGLVNNKDLIGALADNIVSIYVTDFPDAELLALPGVLCIPHLGASTPESEDNCATMAVDELRNYLEKGNIKNSVNYPDCELGMSGSCRLLIANKNVPNMVGQITTLLAAHKINIADMINRHKGDYAYNIINVDGKVTEADLAKIRTIDGIIMARVI